MKVRKVVIQIEAETNWSIKEIKQYVRLRLDSDPNSDNPQTFETKQVQVNVVKK